MCAEVVETLLLATDNRNTTLAALAHGANPLAYTPYGVQSVGAPVQNHLGFNGQLREAATGWYHLGNGHRLYNPVLMRFHSPDRLSPFGKGGLNAYAYCLGDPVNLVDPTGRAPEWLQPVLTIGLHVAIIAANLKVSRGSLAKLMGMSSRLAPLKGKALTATAVSMIGSPIAVVGSAMRLAGVEEGSWVSVAGTALSIATVGTRMTIKSPRQRSHAAGIEFPFISNRTGSSVLNSVPELPIVNTTPATAIRRWHSWHGHSR